MNISDTSPADIQTQLALPLYLHSAQAGFETPIDETESGIDLHQLLVRRPKSSFYARISGDAMREAGIFDGSLLIVDRSLYPNHGDIVVAALEGELLCRQLDLRNNQLQATDPDTPPLCLSDSADLRIEGVVTGSIQQYRG